MHVTGWSLSVAKMALLRTFSELVPCLLNAAVKTLMEAAAAVGSVNQSIMM